MEGVELEILREVDILHNLALERGGWIIVVVVAFSCAPIRITMESDAATVPLAGMGYPTGFLAIAAAHPKVLVGNQQGNFTCAQRVQMKSETLRDVCVAIAAVKGGGQEAVAEAYGKVQEQEMYHGTTLPFDNIDNGVDAATSQQLSRKLARINGE